MILEISSASYVQHPKKEFFVISIKFLIGKGCLIKLLGGIRESASFPLCVLGREKEADSWIPFSSLSGNSLDVNLVEKA